MWQWLPGESDGETEQNTVNAQTRWKYRRNKVEISEEWEDFACYCGEM